MGCYVASRAYVGLLVATTDGWRVMHVEEDYRCLSVAYYLVVPPKQAK